MIIRWIGTFIAASAFTACATSVSTAASDAVAHDTHARTSTTHVFDNEPVTSFAPPAPARAVAAKPRTTSIRAAARPEPARSIVLPVERAIDPQAAVKSVCSGGT